MISQPRIRIGAALFNADHTRLGEELRRTEAAGIDFLHLDVFDGYAVRDQAFPARTIHALRQLTKLPFEVHLSAAQPERFLKPLADAGAELVFLPAEHTPLLYETVYSLRELGMRAGLCLALGTPLQLLEATLPLIDAVLLLGRVTGEGHRGRDFNQLVIGRVRQVRALIDCGHHAVDLQAAGGMEIASCIEAVRAGATSLPLGAALYREADMSAYVAALRGQLDPTSGGAAAPPAAGRSPPLGSQPTTSGLPHSPGARILIASRSFGRNCPEVLDEIRGAGCAFLPHAFQGTPSEAELLACLADADIVVSGTELLNARVLEAAP
jgi:ribulose-phosphate 3-epimerase